MKILKIFPIVIFFVFFTACGSEVSDYNWHESYVLVENTTDQRVKSKLEVVKNRSNCDGKNVVFSTNPKGEVQQGFLWTQGKKEENVISDSVLVYSLDCSVNGKSIAKASIDVYLQYDEKKVFKYKLYESKIPNTITKEICRSLPPAVRSEFIDVYYCNADNNYSLRDDLVYVGFDTFLFVEEYLKQHYPKLIDLSTSKYFLFYDFMNN